MIYDVGDMIRIATNVKDLSGNVTNTPTLALTITKPDGTTTTPTVTNQGTLGQYTADVTADQSGTWLYTWTASGTVVASEDGQFTVRASQVYVASLEEFKAQLRRSDSADDPALRTFLASATRYVEKRLGGPVSVQTFTERQKIYGYTVIPRKRPLVSVTSVTPDFGTVIDPSAYIADTSANQITFYWGLYPAWHTIVYRAGYAQVPENAKLAGLIIAQHLWETQNGFTGRRNSDDFIQTGLGFAVPRRAEQLLSVDYMAGIS